MKLLVGSLYFEPDHSGIAVYANDLAAYLAEQGHDVTVVTGFPFYPQWKKRLADHGRLMATDSWKGIRILRSYVYVPRVLNIVTRIIHELSADQPVERPATLADIRAEVLSPRRLNAFVFSGFAGVAMLIAVVGVAGVLAFSVSARTREFGVRLAIGSTPRRLLIQVLSQGAVIVLIGIIAGVAGGYAVGLVATSYFQNVDLPGAPQVLSAAAVLAGVALLASLMPAFRAARVNVLQALKSE